MLTLERCFVPARLRELSLLERWPVHQLFRTEATPPVKTGIGIANIIWMDRLNLAPHNMQGCKIMVRMATGR